MTINDNFKYLNVGLPDDILRRKQYGDFEGALRLIDLRLAGDIPEALRCCLIAQREIIKRLPVDYPYSLDEALAIIRGDIPDFTECEFNDMVDAGKIDWIYINGESRYFCRFYQTLLKVNLEFSARAKKKSLGGDNMDSDDDKEPYLDRVVRIMKETGRFGARLHICASLRIKDEAFEPGKFVRVHLPIPA